MKSKTAKETAFEKLKKQYCAAKGIRTMSGKSQFSKASAINEQIGQMRMF